jgi:signal transduction histidine kinase
MFNPPVASLKKKLIWTNLLVSAGALLVASAALIAYEVSSFRLSLVRSLFIDAQIVGSNSASALLFGDPDSARNTLSALRASPNILFAGIYSPDGQPFAMYWRDTAGVPPALPQIPGAGTETHWFVDSEAILIRPVVLQGKRIGTVYLKADMTEVWTRLTRYAGIVIAVLLISLLAAFLLSSVFQRAVVRPIVQLAETARIVSRDKEYSIRAPAATTRDEVAVLVGAFNEMLAQIQGRDAALQTAQEELEQRVEQRTAELEAANRELEAFTYSVAHDLRSPLRHIQGYADALVEDFGAQLEPGAKDFLNRIVASSQHMGVLISDLLSLAHVGRQPLNLQVTGLGTLAREVLQSLEPETQGRNIEWRIGDLPFVDCDPGLMKQVLFNLFSNAAKYTRPRSPAVIEAAHTVADGEIVIFVRDNGVGFNMKYADKLFGVFQRLHRREDFEGTGVGLATVRRIIHKHGGRIWAEAEVNRGATFFFTVGAPKG